MRQRSSWFRSRDWRGCLVFSSAILLTVSGVAGCSDDPANNAEGGVDTSPDAKLIDAPNEAQNGGQGIDAAAAARAASVWPSEAKGFTFGEVGGYTHEPAVDAGCTYVGVIYDFVAQTNSLTRQSCDQAKSEVSTLLTEAQRNQLTTKLAAIRSFCARGTGCGADYPEVTLTVRPASGAPTIFTSDFYAGCSHYVVNPPFIAVSALEELGSLLDGFIQAACAKDAGADAAQLCIEVKDDGAMSDAGASEAGDASRELSPADAGIADALVRDVNADAANEADTALSDGTPRDGATD